MEYCYEGPAITNKRVHQEDVTVLFESLITMRSFLIDEMLGESNGRIGPDESKAGFDTNFHTGIWLVDGTSLLGFPFEVPAHYLLELEQNSKR